MPPNPDEIPDYEISFCFNDLVHRDPLNGPACVSIDHLNVHATYVWNGIWHRFDGPAYIIWDRDSGAVIHEHYRQAGRMHREPSAGPADCEWTAEGMLQSEEYWFNGKLYRDPAEGPHTQKWEWERGELKLITREFSRRKRELTSSREAMARRTRWFLGRRIGNLAELGP